MDEKVSELLDLTKKLLDQSMEIVNDSLPDTESVPAEKVRYSIFLRVQMSEVLKFGYGAYYSCKNGWGHGGIGAARSIYEILLDIKYINQEETLKEERFTRFVDHGAEHLYHEMQIMRLLGQKVTKEDLGEREKAFERLKKKYKNKHEQDVKSGELKTKATPRYRPYNWAGIDLSEKVKQVNIDNLDKFHQFYKNLSSLSHVSIGKTLEAITGFNENQYKINLELHPSPNHCYVVLIVMFPCIYWILEEYTEYFKIDLSCHPNLGKIEEDFKNLLKDEINQSESY